MPINNVIQEKRKELGLTQEQVAEYLGVSTPAVNKWEKGATYPDITLLPALARLLNIDLNTLLCFNEGLSEQEINKIIKKASDIIREENFESGFTMIIDKIKEYPNCFKFIYTCALTLDGALMMSGMNPHDKEYYNKKITALYERAAGCDDDNIRNDAVYMMASKYMSDEKYDNAQKMLDMIAERKTIDKRQLQANLWINQGKYTEAAELLERKLLMTVPTEIEGVLMSLIDIALKEGNIDDASILAEISNKTAKLFDQWNFSSYTAQLEVALYKKDIKESIYLIKSMLEAVPDGWKMKESPLYRHISCQANQKNLKMRILPALLSEIENSPKYEFLNSNKEFKQMIEQYKDKL